MEALKGLVSTRFGLLLAVVYCIWQIAEANPEIAERCVYAMGTLTLAHIASRTITNGKESNDNAGQSSLGDDAADSDV
jgi:hypothetical protein